MINAWKKVGQEPNGAIYLDGTRESSAKFITYKGVNYVSISNMLQSLTGKSEYTLSSANNLFLGFVPVSGQVSLTKLTYYDIYDGVDGYEDGDIYFNNFPSNWTNNSIEINGKKYLTGLIWYTPRNREATSWVDYKINNKYSTLKFKVGLDDLSIGTGGTGRISVYGDGEKIYDSGTLEVASPVLIP
ncbi:hypothetical protein G6549_13665 [Bacillus sp. MM2020_1]|nr:hypothetical protein [Bacillus sp. MM2020_1]